MRIVLLNQFYPPALAPTGHCLHDLVISLQACGHETCVITSSGGYGNAGENRFDSVQLEGQTIRIGPRRSHASHPFFKMLDYVHFFCSAGRVLRCLSPAPDVVVSLTTPPFCGLLARRLKKKKGVPYVLWCMDLYPEALVANGFPGPVRSLFGLARSEREGAECIVTLGPDMTERVRQQIPDARVEEIPVWSVFSPSPNDHRNAAQFRAQRGWQDDAMVLMYSGHLGRAHRLDGFIRLARESRTRGTALRFVVSTDRFPPELRCHESSLISWIPPVSAAERIPHLLSADIHLVSQRPEWKGVVVPSKYQAACALGRPVLFDGPADSSVGGWIREDKTGWFLDEILTPEGLSLMMDAQERAVRGANAMRQAQMRFNPFHNLERLVRRIEQSGGVQHE